MIKVETYLENVVPSQSTRLSAIRILSNQAMADMNPFVPFKEGNLRQAVSLSLDGKEIIYKMFYASKRFYTPARKYTTPGTTHRWDLAAQARYQSSWQRVYTKALGL